jgi:hypothetical protein
MDADEEERFRLKRWKVKNSVATMVNPVLRKHHEHAEQLEAIGVIPSQIHAQAACNLIIDKLYIGSADTEHYKELLQRKGITHVLQVVGKAQAARSTMYRESCEFEKVALNMIGIGISLLQCTRHCVLESRSSFPFGEPCQDMTNRGMKILEAHRKCL